MTRLTHGIILVLVLLSALSVAGCAICGGRSTGPGPTSPGAMPTGSPSASLPVTPGDLQDMKYLWDHVHYLHQTSTMVSTIPDMNGLETTMTWKLSDGNFEGQPARLLNIGINSSADQTKVSNSFSFDMAFDVYFHRAGDLLTMLGGQAYIQLGDDAENIMKGDINVSELVEQSRISGSLDPETGETVTTMGEPRFSPTIDLSRPIKPLTGPNDVETTALGSYDINQLMSAGSAIYQGFGNITLTPAGRETLKIGNRDIDCYKYTWTVDLNGVANYTVWYSPEFPAQPLKTVADMNNGESIQTTVVDDWN